MERKNVELPSVDSKLLDNGVGYIQVSEFQTNTASQFEDALDGLTNQGMKGLIAVSYTHLDVYKRQEHTLQEAVLRSQGFQRM